VLSTLTLVVVVVVVVLVLLTVFSLLTSVVVTGGLGIVLVTFVTGALFAFDVLELVLALELLLLSLVLVVPSVFSSDVVSFGNLAFFSLSKKALNSSFIGSFYTILRKYKEIYILLRK